MFSVSIEGNMELPDYDIYADVGGYAGVMKSYSITSDATLDIEFTHGTENPAVKAIEILQIPVVSVGSGPRGMALYQNTPNPFRGSTTLSFSLAQRGPVTLTIYDVAGRLVTPLVNGDLGPGLYRYTWDGRDRLGRRVSSGVYYYELRSTDDQVTKLMTHIR